jgi:hypothetical protein
MSEEMRPSWWIARELGISTNAFLRLMKKFDRRPVGYCDPFNLRGALWDPGQVEKLRETIEVKEARARAARRMRRVKLWQA